MDFSFFAKGLFPFCSIGTENRIQYFNELIGNFIKDGAIDNCPLLKVGDSLKQKIYNGKRPISRKNAQYLLNNIDKEKFSKWIGTQTEAANSWTNVQDWLKKNNEAIKEQDIYPDDACTDLFEQILRDIISSSRHKKDITIQPSSHLESRDLRLLVKFMNDFNKILKFCSITNLTISPMPLELPTEFDLLYERWRYRDTDFKNEKLNLLKYDIINNLYDYFSYWGFLMSYDAYSGYCLYKKPVYKGSEKARKAHLKKAIFFGKTFTNLHEKLCKFVIDANLPAQ